MVIGVSTKFHTERSRKPLFLVVCVAPRDFGDGEVSDSNTDEQQEQLLKLACRYLETAIVRSDSQVDRMLAVEHVIEILTRLLEIMG